MVGSTVESVADVVPPDVALAGVSLDRWRRHNTFISDNSSKNRRENDASDGIAS